MTTRRDVLLAAPAFGVAGVPVLAADQLSEIMTLFREWQAISAAWKAIGDADEEAERAFEADSIVESDAVNRILALPAQSAADLAAKLVAMCDWDDDACFCNKRSAAILEEAGRLVIAAGAAPRHDPPAALLPLVDESPREFAEIDWRAVRIRMAAAGSFLDIPHAEIEEALALSDDELNETGFVRFGGRHGVSLDWLVDGKGRPVRAVESEIMRLFREWVEAYRRFYAADTDEASDRWFAEIESIPARMAPIEPTSAADYARKLCMWHGVTPDDDEAGECFAMTELMVAEARALSGLPRIRSGFRRGEATT